MLKFNFFLAYIAVIILLHGCTGNRLDVDTSDIDLKIEIDRFEQDMFGSNQASGELAKMLSEKYPVFYPSFCGSILRVNEEYCPQAIVEFVGNDGMKEAFQEISEKYEDMSTEQEQLTKAFKHYKYYFLDKQVPRVITYHSGFNYAQGIVDSTVLAIGLDMYLGFNSEFYQYLNWPLYKRNNLERKLIVPDCMRALAQSTYPFDALRDRFIDHLIYNGKLMYFTEAMLPNEEDSILMAYAPEEMEWCEKFEEDLWSLLIEKEMIFSTNYSEYIKYFKDAPFTSGISRESPPRLGTWLGWQIVRSYMEKNQEVSLKMLMENEEYDIIFKQSGYKP